ncbi:hypothetical protein [Arthrobacter sp. UYEF3]|uniref:hypothetical protein n=1 Tax=Arthrobacter sp. UYEF3 TaxID=1756365 RepID=UPI003394C50C
MDGETIRLMVVACGAVLAGLLGALIAGAFNSQNTQATIEAARVAAETQREADREVEHDRWLRDRRLEAYVDFVNEVRDLDTYIHDLATGLSNDHAGLVQSAKQLNGLQVRLLAPADVSGAASEVMAGIQGLIRALTAKEMAGAIDDPSFNAASELLIEKIAKLERLASQDLGVVRGGPTEAGMTTV